MSARRTWLAALAVSASFVASPAAADPGHTHRPTTEGSSPSANPGEPGEDTEPGDGLTDEQRATLATFQRAVQERDAAGVSVGTALEAANLAASVAADAEARATSANQLAAAAQVRAAMAELAATRMREVVDGFAHDMAVGAGEGNQVLISLVVSGKPPAEVLRIAESSERTATTITDSLRELVDLVTAADAARAEAAAAQARAAAAEGRAAAEARRAARLLKQARAHYQDSQKALADLLTTDPVVSEAASYGDIPGCAPAGAAGSFPNGMLPAALLCEPTEAPGHMLRSDAARAFDAMARAFREQRGEPLCITDSYRSLEAQIALKKVKPYLAAVPGTSNHGWGVAVDMCGGIEEFGTDEHNWMRANAPLFGWMHPSWAQQTGSKPEPWHWEFSPELAKQMRGVLGQGADRSEKGQGKKKPAHDLGRDRSS